MRQDEAASAEDGASWSDLGDAVVNRAASVLGLWRAPEPYAGLISAAEARYGLPPNLLERQLYQESHYRADIIDGSTRSSVGALGIAQFMPATAAEMGIDPLDPVQAIDAAARYMRKLFLALGSWSKALAAYNWGIGNVQRKGLDAAPRETRTYWTAILADVNAETGSSYA